MHLIQPAGAPALRPLFDLPQLGFVVDAMQAGNSPATIWADDPLAPRSALIWDTTHSLYLGGDPANPAFNDAVRRLLAGTIIPEGRARNLGLFKIYSAGDAWAALAPSLFGVETLPTRERVLLQLDPALVDRSAMIVPRGITLHRIKKTGLAQRQWRSAERLEEEILSCWTSLERFWAAGFAFVIVADASEIVSWCSTEYVSDKTCGAGIETIAEHQQRGLATFAARAFAMQCATMRWTAHWDSWADNLPSIRVAEKVGFRKISDYAVQIYPFEG